MTSVSTFGYFGLVQQSRRLFIPPFDGFREDALPTKHFEIYIRKNCDSWLAFAIELGFDVRLEDIILNLETSHCVFIRGFRAKRIRPFFRMTLKAAAEPGPDDFDNDPESSIEPVQRPAVPEVGMSSAERSDLIHSSFSIVTHLSGFWTSSQKPGNSYCSRR
ncbi:hypothetical protein EDB87DRAFT_1616089 [Lactarius vividus]|nr:hypothetical protein EDB87DRAFT_1616089 [Lactarius vividus]